MRAATILVALHLAFLTPAAAQTPLDLLPPPPLDQSLIGLPLVTSDGETVGYITQVGFDEGQAIVIGEMVRPLGIGYEPVAIPSEMLVYKGDHAELAMSAEQVRSRSISTE